jgi:molybdopterin molybdotransferase
MFEANSYVLTAQAKEAGALAYRVGIVPDDPRRLVDAVEDQLVRADLVVTTGGTSDRAYDEIREVLTAIGTVSFDHLAMRPGATQGHGVIGPDATPLFTLPGDPVGSFVSLEVLVRPVIRRILRLEPLGRSIVSAGCVGAQVCEPGARDYVRATLDVADGRYVVRANRNDGVRGLVGVDSTNALIVLPESTTYVSDGDAVEVMVLERRNG